MFESQQQKAVIADLHQQVEAQEEQLRATRQQMASEQAQIASDQRELTEATWRQVQFVVDILLDQLKQE